jgi:hypothetical protein
MRTLLERLTEAAELAHVRIQVLPFDAGAHASMDGGFTIVGFPHEGDPDVIYLEHSTSDVYEEEAEAIQRYNLLFSYLQTKALCPEASARFIGEIAAGL